MAESPVALPGSLVITSSADGETAVVTLAGELDVHTATDLRRDLLALIDAGGRDVMLDLGQLEFIDSTGLGVLVGVLKRLEFLDGSLVLKSVRRPARRAFEVTALDGLFTITD